MGSIRGESEAPPLGLLTNEKNVPPCTWVLGRGWGCPEGGDVGIVMGEGIGECYFR